MRPTLAADLTRAIARLRVLVPCGIEDTIAWLEEIAGEVREATTPVKVVDPNEIMRCLNCSATERAGNVSFDGGATCHQCGGIMIEQRGGDANGAGAGR